MLLHLSLGFGVKSLFDVLQIERLKNQGIIELKEIKY
jgi:hypothetical protein